ncbi:MAG: flavodoxin family protein, partial [Oligoflexales bacterium]|nr:flavodoxin family protein [Oligoflexales bacterium]
MKTVVLNGSPRMNKGNTEKILEPFLEGMKGHQIEITRLYLKKMKVESCMGCLRCHENGGQCVIKDDMQILRKLFYECDLLILATPIYEFSYTSYMCKAIERLLEPLACGEIVLAAGNECYVNHTFKRRIGILLITNGSFDGEYTFGP